MPSPEPSAPRIAIIGGGVSGLSAAYRLLERSRAEGLPLDLRLFEASPRLGGVIRSERREGFLLESGPDSFLTTEPAGLKLCERLGLNGELISTKTECRRSYVVFRGGLTPVPDGFSLLGPSRLTPFAFTPLLSVGGKLRALGELLLPPRPANGDESVGSFVKRRFGREVYERLAEPMVRGIASDDPDQLSLQALLPHFAAMEREHGSIIRALRKRRHTAHAAGPRYSLFVSFREGMQALTDTLAAALPPGVAQTETPVSRLARDGGAWRLDVKGQAWEADAVCIALPADRAAVLTAGWGESLSEILRRVPYATWMTLNLACDSAAVKHPLEGFGFVTPAVEGVNFSGCTFVHRKFPGRAPEGSVLLRLFVPLQGPEAESDPGTEAVYRRVLPWMEKLVGLRGEPRFIQGSWHRRALPQYPVGHAERMRGLRENARAFGGLAFAGNAYGGTGVAACVRSGETAADELWENAWARRKYAGTRPRGA